MYTQDFRAELNDLYCKIKERLPASLDCRIVNTYTDKIEIYDPTFGKFILFNPVYNGADFHYVTVDIQPCIVNEETATIHSTYRAKPFELVWDIDSFLPLKKIILEGEEFLCPNDPKRFLEGEYGSLEPNAIYDEKTGKYRHPSKVAVPEPAEGLTVYRMVYPELVVPELVEGSKGWWRSLRHSSTGSPAAQGTVNYFSEIIEGCPNIEQNKRKVKEKILIICSIASAGFVRLNRYHFLNAFLK